MNYSILQLSILKIFLLLGYISCSEPQKKVCSSTTIDSWNGMSQDSCKKKCNENEKCNYYFWNDGRWCGLYEDCNDYKTSVGKGTVMAKRGRGLYCPGKIASFTICNSVMLQN